MNQRIFNDKVDLDYERVQEFFDGRGENKQLGNKYNYVLYQDDCPELAIKRDIQEKEKISKLLSLEKNQRVLDIGCGIGRWGEWLLDKGLYYVGIDGSSKMVERAKDNLRHYPNKCLMKGNFQEFIDCLKKADEYKPFDKVFVNGVFMYLNDTDYIQALKDIHSVCAEHCELYLKESMGVETRLTLNQIYSESLTQNYSAIYRSIEEYRESFRKEFGGDFDMVTEEQLFDEDLTNRKETTDYFFIWKR